MGLIITVLLLGLLASISPSTIVVFILMLATTRARANGGAFLIGWSVSLIIVFAASYALGGVRVGLHGTGRIAVDVIEVLLGIALLAMAARQWRHRNIPRSGTGLTKKLTQHLDRLTPWKAAVIGALELIRHHSAVIIALVAFIVFTVVSTATVGLMFLYFARRPGEAEAHLSTLRDRLVRAGPTIFVVVTLLVGCFLMIDGTLGIVGA
jgi:hypothetical protein